MKVGGGGGGGGGGTGVAPNMVGEVLRRLHVGPKPL